MKDSRRKNVQWRIFNTETGECWSPGQYGYTALAVLMDIRDELQTLNRLLHCPNFTQIPTVLRSIRRNTAKPRKVK
jgi:hypothetical protein